MDYSKTHVKAIKNGGTQLFPKQYWESRESKLRKEGWIPEHAPDSFPEIVELRSKKTADVGAKTFNPTGDSKSILDPSAIVELEAAKQAQAEEIEKLKAELEAMKAAKEIVPIKAKEKAPAKEKAKA